MKRLLLLFTIFWYSGNALAQNAQDTSSNPKPKKNVDDPSQFFTRAEVFNEFQHYENDVNINQSVLRVIFKIGKRFTTRVDFPFVVNSFTSPAEFKQSGIGDISLRLLGYQFFENPKSAFTGSIEVSLNTAQSPILGLGKNLVIPLVTYSKLLPKQKLLFAAAFQQANSVSGDESRSKVSFSKLQILFIRTISGKSWVVLAPEWFLDYVHGGLSMNLRSRFTHAPTPRMNLWITPSAGIFGDFPGRYQWSLDVGGRYFFLRDLKFKKKGRS